MCACRRELENNCIGFFNLLSLQNKPLYYAFFVLLFVRFYFILSLSFCNLFIFYSLVGYLWEFFVYLLFISLFFPLTPPPPPPLCLPNYFRQVYPEISESALVFMRHASSRAQHALTRSASDPPWRNVGRDKPHNTDVFSYLRDERLLAGKTQTFFSLSLSFVFCQQVCEMNYEEAALTLAFEEPTNQISRSVHNVEEYIDKGGRFRTGHGVRDRFVWRVS